MLMVPLHGWATKPDQCSTLSIIVSLHLHYRRWLRGPDKRALIVAFGDIMESRNLEDNGPFNLTLSFDEALKSSWSIHKPVRKIPDLGRADLILGISTPHGIIPISTKLPPEWPCSITF
jgi:hypothetical protein